MTLPCNYCPRPVDKPYPGPRGTGHRDCVNKAKREAKHATANSPPIHSLVDVVTMHAGYIGRWRGTVDSYTGKTALVRREDGVLIKVLRESLMLVGA